MDRASFQRQALSLCHILDNERFRDREKLLRWRLVPSNHDEYYLVHPPIIQKKPNNSEDAWSSIRYAPHEGTITMEEETVTMEDMTIQTDEEGQPAGPSMSDLVLEWNFSIAYSDTWRVPVLYFSVQDSSGTLLTQSQIMRMLTVSQQRIESGVEEEEQDWISYDEHPYTRLPTCFLHPCQTADRLKLLVNAAQSTTTTTSDKPVVDTQLLSWLSWVLPVVGFQIDAAEYVELWQAFIA